MNQVIKLPDADIELTVESSDQGPRITVQRGNLRMSFTLPLESAERVLRALEGAIQAQLASKR